MDTKHSPAHQLKLALASGALSPAEAARRLTAAIEAEYHRPHPDADFINACEDLLWEIHTAGAQPFVSAGNRFEAALTARRHESPRRTLRPGLAWTAAALAACCLFMLCCGQGGTPARLSGEPLSMFPGPTLRTELLSLNYSSLRMAVFSP